MKIILLFILQLISINLFPQFAYPYKVYSENGEFFIKSIPFSDQAYTNLGKSIVCKTSDSSKVLYTLPRYFQPDYLFLSNNGKSVCFIINKLTPSTEYTKRQVVFFYNLDNLIRTFTFDNFIDSTLNKRNYSLLYKNDKIDSLVAKNGRLINVGFKKGTDSIAKYLNINNAFVSSDSLYLLTQNQIVNIFNLKDGSLIGKLHFNEYTKSNLVYPNPRRIIDTKIKIPKQFGLPDLSNGENYCKTIAEKMDLVQIERVNNEVKEKYKIYSFSINCCIDSSGQCSNVRIECKDTVFKNDVLKFFQTVKFVKDAPPPGIEKWYFNHIVFFRKESEQLAIEEREQEKIFEKIEYQKRIVADSINRFYIPKDLYDCFQQLNKILILVDRNEFNELPEREAVTKYHMSLGMWLRNNWGLWSGSRLSIYFNNLAINEPDDMTGIILTSYHRFLNDKDIQLDDQISYYKMYWEKAKQIKPTKGTPILFN